ncbi:D-amino-acid oxidase [Strongyloides ratti]|uniref:D-amino-acid oxidase n=1 Tax=Strongyloides ratti TaxID=34506 RepID=A0A090L4F4_STRRB|nr:D-amino-acid oxidase [Strongyloides ratti]CEF64671.1 D-amino-acid oxidase [Strongyloides ratti]
MMFSKNIAIIGEGVIGVSSALAINQKFPHYKITIFHDRPFDKTCSFGPAGLFRLDKEELKPLAKVTFERMAFLEKTEGPKTGIKLLSGHIQSDDKERLTLQEKNMSDIVYNFRWLTDRERQSLFIDPLNFCIHYTAYASEGKKYVPWMKEILQKNGIQFIRKEIKNVNEIGKDYDIVINCGGLNGGKISGDDDTVYPIRGVVLELDSIWHKHFNYKDFVNFTIPMSNSVALGTVKQDHRYDTKITDDDRKEIWDNYLKIHPTMKEAKILNEWCHLRPERKSLRLESEIRKLDNDKKYLLIHNYGHGGNGFTLHWGCALKVVEFIENNIKIQANSWDSKSFQTFKRYREAKLKGLKDSLIEEEKQIKNLENIKNQITEYGKKLTHNLWMPFGNVAFFPAKLYNTNKYTVLLGDNYFVDASGHEACGIIDRRLELLNERVEKFKTAIKNTEDEIKYGGQFFQNSDGTVEIIEEYVEPDEETKKKRAMEFKKPSIPEEEYNQLMAKLDELELLEDGSDEEDDDDDEDEENDEEENLDSDDEPDVVIEGDSKIKAKKNDLDSDDDDVSEDGVILHNEIVDDLANFLGLQDKRDQLIEILKKGRDLTEIYNKENNSEEVMETNEVKKELSNKTFDEKKTLKRGVSWSAEDEVQTIEKIDELSSKELEMKVNGVGKGILTNKDPSPIDHEAVKRMNEEDVNTCKIEPMSKEAFTQNIVERSSIPMIPEEPQATEIPEAEPYKPMSRFKRSKMWH